jgi:phage terminase large subunit
MKIQATPVFQNNWDALNSGKYKYIINSGSSRSSKTFSILQIFWLLAWTKPRTKLAVFRNTKKDCKDTILNDMLKYYPTLDDWDKIVFNKTESVFTFPNGSTINIEGTDDDLKVHGYHSDYLWFNEFYRMSKDTFDQLDMRCTTAVFMDYNPIGRLWSDDLTKQDNAILIHSTFKDNPFIPLEQKRKILGYEPNEYNKQQKTADAYKWSVYGLGLKAEKPNRIYKNWIKVSDKQFSKILAPSYYGLDFGSANPSALVEVKYRDHNFYSKQRLYLPISQMQSSLADVLKGLGLTNKDLIIADSADPTRIAELINAGLNVLPAIKGQGSVNQGLDFVNSMTNHYTENSVDLEYEVENYEWEIVNGMNLNRPIKKDDHLIDADRYIKTFLQFHLDIK